VTINTENNPVTELSHWYFAGDKFIQKENIKQSKLLENNYEKIYIF